VAVGWLSYRPPYIDAVVVQTADTSLPEVAGALFNKLNGATAGFMVTLYGRFFGPWVDETGDTVVRAVQSQALLNSSFSDAAWDGGQALYPLADYNRSLWRRYWSDTRVVLVTTLSSALIRLRFTGRALNGTAVSTFSNNFDYLDLSPQFGALVGGLDNYVTPGSRSRRRTSSRW